MRNTSWLERGMDEGWNGKAICHMGTWPPPGIINWYHQSLFIPTQNYHRKSPTDPNSCKSIENCSWSLRAFVDKFQFEETYFPTSPKFGDFRSLVGRQQSLRAVDTLQEDAVFPLPFCIPTVSGHFQFPILLFMVSWCSCCSSYLFMFSIMFLVVSMQRSQQ